MMTKEQIKKLEADKKKAEEREKAAIKQLEEKNGKPYGTIS